SSSQGQSIPNIPSEQQSIPNIQSEQQSNSQISNIPIKFKQIDFRITVDRWYKESSWNILSTTIDRYIFPSYKKFSRAFETINMSLGLPNGKYKLCIQDTYGDGGVSVSIKENTITLLSARMSYGKKAEYDFTIS